jgi:hypothetical protein
MKDDRDEQDFLAQARKALDSGSDNLEASTRSRLTRARMNAVEQGKSRGVRRWLWVGAPLTVCLAAVLMVAVLFFRGGIGGSNQAGEVVADLEIITAAETTEFYADLEFYQWLAGENGHAGG